MKTVLAILILIGMGKSFGNPSDGRTATEECNHHIDEYFFKSCLGETRVKFAKELGKETCHGVQDEAFYYMCRADHGLGNDLPASRSQMISWCEANQFMLQEECIARYQILN